MALKGIKVVEMAGLAPAPFCGMVLSDFGAKVVRIDRPKALDTDRLCRGKQSLIVNLKREEGRDVIRRMCKTADVLLEPYRPGVMEKLGLGPDIMLKQNPRLVYARLSGFGQSGPLAVSAGHDINYIAISGLLSMLGRKNERPYPPINLLADFAGGGLICALGIVMSLFERQSSNKGQVVDVSMAHGSAYVGSFLWSTQDLPLMWGKTRGDNLLDGGKAFYDVYETKDGKFMSVGALEPQFFEELLKGLNLDSNKVKQLDDPSRMQQTFQEIFKTKSRDEWCHIFEKKDACVQPVLERDEAHLNLHNKETHIFLHDSASGRHMPAPAPVLSRTPGIKESLPRPKIGQHTVSVLKEYGFQANEITGLLKNGIVEECKETSKL